MMRSAPQQNYIGVEVHRPGVGKLINDADRAGVRNLKVFCDDAIDVLARYWMHRGFGAALIDFEE